MPDPSSRFAAFLAELRHRRVFRVAAVYAGMAFVLGEVANNFFPALNIPDWAISFVVVLLVIGFPIAVALAWAFDLTTEGLVRAKPKREPTAAKAPHHPLVGNKTLAVIAAVAVAAAVWSWWGRPSAAGAITSIAVLPLENLMNDPEQDYFVDGMHDALISELGKIGALRVIGRTSVLGYRDAPKPIPEIAQELNVDAVVEGSVLLVGGEVKITAQLVAASPERHLWTDSYTRSVSNVLSLHSDVARAIAREIGLALTPEEEAYLVSAPPVNPEAYNLYLKGWHIHKLGDHHKAEEYLEQAVALDSTFARAWAALAFNYIYTDGIALNPIRILDYGLNLMKQALDKALELDPAQSDAHTYLGLYQCYNWEFVAAEASFRRALELDPHNVNAHDEYGWFLQRSGRPDEGLAEFRRSQELDPLAPKPLEGIAQTFIYTREYNKALEYGQASSELQPGYADYLVNWTKCDILIQQGLYAEAAAGAEKAGDLFRQLRAEWAWGNREKVYAVRDSLKSTGELQQREQEHPFWSARLYAIMGERDKTLSLLEKAYEDTTNEFYYSIGLVYYPEFDSLRAEPRFKDLIKKFGLTEVFDQYGERIR